MLKLIINTSADQAEFIADFLTEREALALSLEDGGDQPLFQAVLNETPLWKSTQIHAFFDDSVPVNSILQDLTTLLSSPLDYKIESVVAENWVEKTQQNFPARCFANRLWVVPSGQVLRINPGLGFGTGAHPTTSLCLEWLAMQDLEGKTVVDYGCGSGILGLAALALGAKKVWAIDYDPQALLATRNNAELNHFAETAFSILLPEQLPPIQAEIILANILANPLCELAPKLINHLAPQGELVLSGFLMEEKQRVIHAYFPALQVLETAIQDNWLRVVLAKTR